MLPIHDAAAMEEAAMDSASEASQASLVFRMARPPATGGISPADIEVETCVPACIPAPVLALLLAACLACMILLSISRSSSSSMRVSDDDRACGLASLIGSDPVKDEDRWVGAAAKLQRKSPEEVMSACFPPLSLPEPTRGGGGELERAAALVSNNVSAPAAAASAALSPVSSQSSLPPCLL